MGTNYPDRNTIIWLCLTPPFPASLTPVNPSKRLKESSTLPSLCRRAASQSSPPAIPMYDGVLPPLPPSPMLKWQLALHGCVAFQRRRTHTCSGDRGGVHSWIGGKAWFSGDGRGEVGEEVGVAVAVAGEKVRGVGCDVQV